MQNVDTEIKTFRSKYSQLTQSQLIEAENWGKSHDGYTGGGNFDDNPLLKVFTIKKYNIMKEQGQLSKISKIEESKAYAQFLKDSNSQSQMLLLDENKNFEIDDIRQQSELVNYRKKKSAIQKRQLYNNNSSNYNYKVGANKS